MRKAVERGNGILVRENIAPYQSSEEMLIRQLDKERCVMAAAIYARVEKISKHASANWQGIREGVVTR